MEQQQKLRLKEPSSVADKARLGGPGRHVPPAPPSRLARLRGVFRGLGTVVLLAGAVVAALLVAPARQWDSYAVWEGLRSGLCELDADPASITKLRTVLGSAGTAGLLWDQPSGARPEGMWRALSRSEYDARYAVVQTVALGVVAHGKADRGLGELSRLKRRTGLDRLPDLPDTGAVKGPCSQCRLGMQTAGCAVCGGQKACKRCGGSGKLSYALRSTHNQSHLPAKRLGEYARSQAWECSTCMGSGKCAGCSGAGALSSVCTACGGTVSRIDYVAATNLFLQSVKSTIAVIDEGEPRRRWISRAAGWQRRLLGMPGPAALQQVGLRFPEPTPAAAGPVTSAPQPAAPAASPDWADFGQEGHVLPPSGGLSEERLLSACETLQRAPLRFPELATLAEAARTMTNCPALRCRAMAAVALAHLIQRNTNKFERAMQIERSLFPDQGGLVTVTLADCLVRCEACDGSGVCSSVCPGCQGPARCTECGGDGENPAGENVIPCKICKSKGLCKMCKGLRRMNVGCFTCRETGKLFVVGNGVVSNYNALLSGLAGMCRETVSYDRQLHEASRVPDWEVRLALLESVTNQFAGRDDLWRATSLLEEAGESRDRFEQAVAAARAAVSAAPEVEALQAVDEKPDVGCAIATLREYLEEHPDSPSRDEIKQLLDRLLAKPQRKGGGGLRLAAAWGAGAVAAAFGLVRLYALRHRRKRRWVALPGMSLVDPEAITDPLSLTARESRTRQEDGTEP